MGSFVNIQLMADMVLGLAIVVVVLYLYRLEKVGWVRNQVLVERMEQAVLESRRAADDFITLLEANHRAFVDLGKELDLKKHRLDSVLDHATKVLNSQDNEKVRREGNDEKDGADPYEKVVEMLKEGLSVKEVAERTRLPESEIGLIRRLRIPDHKGQDPCPE